MLVLKRSSSGRQRLNGGWCWRGWATCAGRWRRCRCRSARRWPPRGWCGRATRSSSSPRTTACSPSTCSSPSPTCTRWGAPTATSGRSTRSSDLLQAAVRCAAAGRVVVACRLQLHRRAEGHVASNSFSPIVPRRSMRDKRVACQECVFQIFRTPHTHGSCRAMKMNIWAEFTCAKAEFV